MDHQDDFDRIVASLHECSLNSGCWDRTAALLAESFQLANSHLAVVGPGHGGRGPSYLFGRLDYQGRPRPGLEYQLAVNDWPTDERTPRIIALPHGCIVSGNGLWTEYEKPRSRVYNRYFHDTPEFPGRTINQLFVRMDVGPAVVGLCLGRTDDSGEWTSDQISLIDRLLSHFRQFIHTRQSLAAVNAWGVAFEKLLLMPWHGLILLDRDGTIMTANDRARRILSHGDDLGERDGFLFACSPADNTRLRKLLGEALPRPGKTPVGGSITLRRAVNGAPLQVHATPVTIDQADYGARRVAALVRITDPAARTRTDPVTVRKTLDLTPAQSQVAALLAQGKSVRDIAAATNRKEASVRSLIKQIHLRLGISRQADLVRMVLTAASY